VKKKNTIDKEFVQVSFGLDKELSNVASEVKFFVEGPVDQIGFDLIKGFQINKKELVLRMVYLFPSIEKVAVDYLKSHPFAEEEIMALRDENFNCLISAAKSLSPEIADAIVNATEFKAENKSFLKKLSFVTY
jgi:hypothetical protein